MGLGSLHPVSSGKIATLQEGKGGKTPQRDNEWVLQEMVLFKNLFELLNDLAHPDFIDVSA